MQTLMQTMLLLNLLLTLATNATDLSTDAISSQPLPVAEKSSGVDKCPQILEAPFQRKLTPTLINAPVLPLPSSSNNSGDVTIIHPSIHSIYKVSHLKYMILHTNRK